MAYVRVYRETGTGERLAVFNAGNGLDPRVVKLAPAASFCLRFIDPYGDFVVNQIQLPVLIDELNEMRRLSNEDDLHDHIDSLVRFLMESKEPHVYIRFLGD